MNVTLSTNYLESLPYNSLSPCLHCVNFPGTDRAPRSRVHLRSKRTTACRHANTSFETHSLDSKDAGREYPHQLGTQQLPCAVAINDASLMCEVPTELYWPGLSWHFASSTTLKLEAEVLEMYLPLFVIWDFSFSCTHLLMSPWRSIARVPTEIDGHGQWQGRLFLLLSSRTNQ
jgi:hypothetical protein